MSYNVMQPVVPDLVLREQAVLAKRALFLKPANKQLGP